MAEAVRTACGFLGELDCSNVIIEVANEHDVGGFSRHPLFSSGEGMGLLIRLAKEWSGGKFAVGCSGGGGSLHPEVLESSDVILVHGNGLRRQEYCNFIRRIREYQPDKPVVCNEDSQMFSQLSVSRATHTSWGYYNNFTKQEPPADWGVTRGEDAFFARRLEDLILGREETENEFYLQGFEKDSTIDGRRYVRLASLYPEKIDFVEFFEDGRLLDLTFSEPFPLYGLTTWQQKPYLPGPGAGSFTARIHLHTGRTVEKAVRF